MTSVVDTSVKHFLSGAVGAPVLTGVAGSMIALLSACLVDGYDVKAATSLVVAGGVATLAFSGAHSASVGSVVLVTGVTGALAALNGEQKVTALGVGVVKFATAADDGTATGTVTFKMAPAGWAKPFTGANLAVFRSTDPMGTRMSLRVNDASTTFTRVIGYETMTAVSTGAGPFPTNAQMSGGGYWPKSNSAGSTPIPWVLISDGRSFFLHSAPFVSSGPTLVGGSTRSFGDGVSYRPSGDSYACALSFATTAEASDGTPDGTTALQMAMPRAVSGTGTSSLHASLSYIGTSILSGLDDILGAFPSPVDGGLVLCKRYLASGTATPPRCDFPGLYHVPMTGAWTQFKTRDFIPGTGPLTGRTLLALNPTQNLGNEPSAGVTGVSFIDITGPWR